MSLEHAERDKEAHAAIRQSLREQVGLQLPSDIVGRLEARQSTLRSRGLVLSIVPAVPWSSTVSARLLGTRAACVNRVCACHIPCAGNANTCLRVEGLTD